MPGLRRYTASSCRLDLEIRTWRYLMAKSQDKKSTTDKKKPLKSIKEKRAAKKAKKEEKDS